MQPKRSPSPKNVALSIVAALLISAGIFLLIFAPALIESIANTIMTFDRGSKLHAIWEASPFPLPLRFYLFNWTNCEEANTPGVKPKFEELGPYTFVEVLEKVDVVWNDDNRTVSYRNLRNYRFDESNSNGSLNDEINTPNTIALSAAYKARDWSYVIKKGLSMTLRSMAPTVHVTTTAGELLFDGYEDPLLTMSHNLPFLADAGMPKLDRFAWFRLKNASKYFDGVLNMGYGRENFGELKRWNHQNQSNYYDGSCGEIRGSAGEFYKRPITKRGGVEFFSTDLCRHMRLDFVEEADVAGIRGYKFAFGDSLLDNGTKIPENSCFCTGECVPSGVKNVSNCRYGTPSFASLPHFHKADPYYLSLVDGLRPEKDLHESYMIFEPNLAIPLEVNIALQLNLLLQPIDHITLFEDVPRAFVPVLWFKQNFRIPEDMAFQIYVFLKLPLIATVISCALITTGSLLVAFVFYKLLFGDGGEQISFGRSEEVPLRSEKTS